MREEIFYMGTDSISLEGECIVAFRTLSKDAVKCRIEKRTYNTVYRLKRVEIPRRWGYGSAYFIQVRKNRK